MSDLSVVDQMLRNGSMEDYLKLLNHKPVTCGDARRKECSE